MKKPLAGIICSVTFSIGALAQEEATKPAFELVKYELQSPPIIGQYNGVTIHEGGISGMHVIPGASNEFYLLTDRGPNADASSANAGKETILFPFPDYAPKIFRARADSNTLQISQTLPLKKGDGSTTNGIPKPFGLGSSGEVAWVDTNKSPATTDPWGIDSECLTVDAKGDFWIGDEYGPSVWHVDGKTGRAINRYIPFGGLPSEAATHDVAIDSVFAKRRPNRGFEGIACTPGGKVYAILQGPMNNPDKAAGESSRLHRILEIDPRTNALRTFVYEHEAPTANIRNKDWSVGDMAAINDHELLVIEHAMKKGENVKKIFHVDLSHATPITREDFNGKTLEQLENAENCRAHGIVPVEKKLYIDLLANGWDPSHKKPEGLAIVNAKTFCVINDNDFGVDSPAANGLLVATGTKTALYQFTAPKSMALNFMPPVGAPRDASRPDKGK